MRKVRLRIWLARLMLVASAIGWPLSAFTWARDEPPFVLGLSWLAILITAFDVLLTAEVEEKQERDSE